MFGGEVVAGHYVNSTVSTNGKGQLVVQTGLKWRKLTTETVAEWDLVNVANRSRVRGVAGAAAKALDSVVGSALFGGLVINGPEGSKTRSRSTVRIDWVDGKQSVIALPGGLFEQLEVDLQARRLAPASPRPEPEAPPPSPALPPPTTQPDVFEQIARLATLHDQGVLTEDEFATKKAELLARL